MPPYHLTRRQFLRLTTLATIAAGAVVIDRATQPVGAPAFLRWLTRGRARDLLGRPAVVGLGQCPTYDAAAVFDCLEELWQQSEMPAVAGKRVLIKPNLIDYIDGYPVTTGPAVVGAVLDLMRRLGAAEVVVGDGPGFRREAWPVVEASGLAAVLAARQAQFVDLNYDDPQPVPARGGWFRQEHEIWLPRHVREADLIVSVPKLKTHHWAGVSLSLKNLFGIVPGARYGWPKNMLHVNGIPFSVLGLYDSAPPVVSIVDGIVGMQGDGPLFGTPVAHGLLAVGRDPVAVDVTCSQLMGIAVDDVAHLKLATWAGVGEGADIDIRGAAPEDLQRYYLPPPAF